MERSLTPEILAWSQHRIQTDPWLHADLRTSCAHVLTDRATAETALATLLAFAETGWPPSVLTTEQSQRHPLTRAQRKRRAVFVKAQKAHLRTLRRATADELASLIDTLFVAPVAA